MLSPPNYVSYVVPVKYSVTRNALEVPVLKSGFNGPLELHFHGIYGNKGQIHAAVKRDSIMIFNL